MTPRQLHARYRRIAEEVLFHRCLYYVFGHPILSDADYDQLERELEAFEREFDVMHPESPSQKPGSSLWNDYPVMVRAAVRQHLHKRGLIKEMFPGSEEKS